MNIFAPAVHDDLSNLELIEGKLKNLSVEKDDLILTWKIFRENSYSVKLKIEELLPFRVYVEPILSLNYYMKCFHEIYAKKEW